MGATRGAGPLLAAAAITSLVLLADAASSHGAAAPTAAVRVGAVPPAMPLGLTPSPTPRPPALARCPAAARACVDTRHRVAWLQRRGRPTYGPVPVALGRVGHRTPKGRFAVAWKAPHWTSTEYGLPMPWSVFFAAGGIAFHAGPLRVPSHGCVHLHRKDARVFFDRLQVGDVVVVR